MYVAMIGLLLDIYVVVICSASPSCNSLTHLGPETQDTERLLPKTASWVVTSYCLEPRCIDWIE
jgi:hypothetical protein